MTKFLMVCLAGAMGTGVRYGIGLWAARFGEFPFGTFIVNVIGCFLISFVYQLGLVSTRISPTTATVLMTGFMGGLTTYSAFNQQTTLLLQERAWGLALLNVTLTLLVCFGAGLLGFAVARRIEGT